MSNNRNSDCRCKQCGQPLPKYYKQGQLFCDDSGNLYMLCVTSICTSGLVWNLIVLSGPCNGHHWASTYPVTEPAASFGGPQPPRPRLSVQTFNKYFGDGWVPLSGSVIVEKHDA